MDGKQHVLHNIFLCRPIQHPPTPAHHRAQDRRHSQQEARIGLPVACIGGAQQVSQGGFRNAHLAKPFGAMGQSVTGDLQVFVENRAERGFSHFLKIRRNGPAGPCEWMGKGAVGVP